MPQQQVFENRGTADSWTGYFPVNYPIWQEQSCENGMLQLASYDEAAKFFFGKVFILNMLSTEELPGEPH